jgi:threonine/homoserine/homoserine lactone efflux protein
MDTLWLYAVLVFGIILLPGMDMAFVLASALAGGRRAGFAAVAGMVAGGFVHVFASGLGLALLIQSHAGVFNGLLLGGGLYVAWLGWQLWRGAGALAAVPTTAVRPWFDSFARALLTCLMNPKAYLFCLAVLPQFLHPERGAVLGQVMALFLIGALAQLLVYGAVALAASAAKARLAGSARAQVALGRSLGLMLMGLAVWTLGFGWR